MEQRLCKIQVISLLICRCESSTLKAETGRKIFVSGKKDIEHLIQRPYYKYGDSLQTITVDAVLKKIFTTLCKRRKLQRLGHTTRHNTIANETLQGND